MFFLFSNKRLFALFSMVLILAVGFFFVRKLLTEADSNLTSLSGYSSSLMNNNDLKVGNIGNFELAL